LKTNNNFKETIKPTVPDTAYDKEHLVAGNENAKHKILVFSDPMCPFCQEIVPDLLKSAALNPTDIAVYYYHLPLVQIHPVSPALTQIMHIAQSQGKNDMITKIYALKINPSETKADVIAKAVKAQTGFVVTPAQMNAPAVLAALKGDEDMAAKLMVGGTPTIFIDGKLDKMREGYKALVAKK
jgi:protein-disulfide isomerase